MAKYSKIQIGQCDQLYGEYNGGVEVRKEMVISAGKLLRKTKKIGIFQTGQGRGISANSNFFFSIILGFSVAIAT